MTVKRNHIILVYIFLYLSLLVGFYYGEDFAGCFKYDLQTHKMLLENLFNESLSYGLLNYDIFYVPHSPIFIIYLLFLISRSSDDLLSTAYTLDMPSKPTKNTATILIFPLRLITDTRYEPSLTIILHYMNM